MTNKDTIKNVVTEGPDFEFRFLTDQALSTDEELENPRFGHKEIAAALVKSVEKSPAPFTIGLFGKWGAGKSSIANILQRDLEKKKIPVVIFDVWKHQGDALRRTFLRECLSQLKAKKFTAIDPKFDLDERLDKSVQTSSDEPILNIPWEKLKKAVGIIFALFVLFTLIDGWFFDFNIIGRAWEILVAAMSLTLFLGVLHYGSRVLKHVVDTSDFVLKRFVTSKAVTYTVDKFADPQDFEEEFGRMIGALKQTRLLVVFDNLDRVTHKRAVEVLTTIKTFLEPKDLEIKEKEVVFVIPCDADAIREHIGSVYKVTESSDNSAFNRDEFLKKFFNAIFWIPEFIPTELEAYTREMLQQTKVEDLDNDKVAWLITKAYRENPRQIKQFINILLANYLLVRERQGGEGKDFPEDFLEKNVPQLTKFLLLYQCYPKEIAIIREKKIADLQDAIAQIKEFSNGFKDFVNETTSNTPISDIRIFFTLRISDQEKKLPGVEDFFISLEDGKVTDAESYLERIKNFEEIQETLSQVLEGKLGNITNELTLGSFISTLLSALDSNNLRLTEIAYGEITQKLTQKAVQYIDMAKPSVLASQIAEPLAQYRNDIIEKWQALLSDLKLDQPTLQISEEYWKDLFSVIVNHGDWFDAYKDEIKEILSKRFTPGVWVAKLFKGKPDEQKRFLDSRFTINFISSISSDDIEKGSLDEKIDLLYSFDESILDVNSYNTLINKLNELLALEAGRPVDAENEATKLKIIEISESVIEQYEKAFKDKITEPAIWQNPAQQLINGINQNPDWNNRKIFMPLSLKIMQFLPDPQLNELRELIKNFINSSSKDSLEYFISRIEDQLQFIGASEFAPNFEERALSAQDIFDLLFNKLSDEKKNDWLLKLLDRDSSRFFQKLKDENYSVPNVISIVDALLSGVEAKPSQEQQSYFEAINSMKCGNDAALKDKYLDVFTRALTNLDQNIQQIAFQALSAESCLGVQRQRTLTKAVLDWLKKPEVSDKYQASAIKAVQRGYERLNIQEKGEYLQFIFEELIYKRNDMESIRTGFELLSTLKPTYDERKENYEDIRGRIERETDPNVKNILVQELKKLGKIVASKRKSEKEYWDWLETQEPEST